MNKQYFNLTNPQGSIWLTEQMFPNTSIGNICGTVFIDEKLDFPALERSINCFVQKNDSFRIIIENTQDGPRQYIDEFKPFNVEIKKIN